MSKKRMLPVTTRQRKPLTLVCSWCRKTEKIPRTKMIHAARQRCSSCGGPLNRGGQS